MPLNFARNILQKGMNTNVDFSKFPPDSAYDIVNARILSVDGNNFVVRNRYGNEEKFSVSEGFRIIGSKAYNKILYIVSVNEDNVCEIGCFPSPKRLSFRSEYSSTSTGITYKTYDINSNDGVEYVYKPLPCIKAPGNITGHGEVFGFRTKIWKFRSDDIIFPLIKEAY